MNKYLFATVLVAWQFTAFAQSSDRDDLMKFKYFHKGESLTYTCSIGMLKVGKATAQVDTQLHEYDGNTCYKINVDGSTTGMFAMGMKVEDNWQSFVDTGLIIPHKFYRDIHENNYLLEETTYFDHAKKSVLVDATLKGKKRGGTYEIPQYSQDLISGYLYLRTLDFENMEVGNVVSVNAFFEDRVYDFKIKYLGKQVIKTRFGKLQTYVLTPIMPNNSLFLSGENAIKIWVSADENRVPLKVHATMLFGIGLVEVSLTEHSGLQAAFEPIKKRRK